MSLMQLLDALVKMDAHDTHKVIEMAHAHLRDIEKAFDKACVDVYEGITKDTPSAGRTPWQQAVSHLPDESRSEANIQANRELAKRTDGAELQAGLEEAVVRERERLADDGWIAWEEPSDGPPKGHVGHTDDF